MAAAVPEGLVDWAHSVGLEGYLSKADIESGRTIHMAMKNIVDGHNIQLQSSNTAVSRVSNWNALMQEIGYGRAELKQIGIRVGQDEKTKIINGNHDIVFQILVRLRDYHQRNQKETEVDISKITVQNQISDSTSLLELFILVIMRNFGLSAKESVALLSNDSKYLAHILAKGLKGDFKPVEGLIADLSRNMAQIASFCRNKENETFFLRAVKPTLISKSETVSEKGLNLLSAFLSQMPSRFELIKEHLVSTLVLGIRRHPYLIAEFARFMIAASDFHQDLLVCLKPETSETDLQNIFLAMWTASKQINSIDSFFKLKGINEIVSKSIANIKSSDAAVSSLNLLISLAAENPDLLSDPDEASALVENVQEVTLSKVSANIMFIQQLFTLLSILGRDKNQLAPSLYKVLLFKFQKSVNETQSRVFIQNFKETVQEFPTIPFTPIVEAISTRIEQNTLTVTQNEIEFFFGMIRNEALDAKGGLMIYNMVSKHLIEEPAFTETCSQIIMILLKRFIKEPIFTDMSIKLTKVCLAIHFANVKKLAAKRKSVTGSAKLDPEDLSYKMKNVMLESFMYKLLEQDISEINANSQPLISYSLIQVENLGRQFGAGLRRILGLLGDPNEIIKKYESEARKLEEEQGRRTELGKKSKLKEVQRYGPTEKRDRSHTNSEQGIPRPKLLNRLDTASLHQSHLGVTPAAQRGLQKYQKVYLSKIEKISKEEVKKKEGQDRQEYLKKVFERKMLDNGISVKVMKEDEFQYIYDFGVKERELAKDENKGLIHLLYYEPDDEEERDNKGLEYSIKKYQRVLRVYYNVYSGFQKPKTLDLFDKIAEKGNYIYAKAIWKLLKDHSLDEFISVKEVQYLIKKINTKLDKRFDDMSCLDYQGFEQFIIQASFSMFTRPPKDLSGHPVSEMLDQTISRLRLYAGENKINEKLFDDPDSQFSNETEAIKQLNRKLEQNPDYILPEGYKKIVEKRVIFTHRIFLDAMSETYKDVYEIVNEILFNCLGVNAIEPFSTYETVAKARPVMYQKNDGGDFHTSKMTLFLKRQVSKFPIKERAIAIQVGEVMEDIIDAVERGHDQIGLKLENKLERERKQQQEQLQRQKQAERKKWQDRKLKIKSAVQKHHEIEKQKQAEKKQKEEEQRKKKELEKEKQRKEEERLKKKVQEYLERKKEDQKRRKEERKEALKKEKEEEERKKKELEETKKKIEEAKQAKREEQAEKKRIEQQQTKRRKAEEKRRFDEEQRRKKEMVNSYKMGKSGITQSKVMDKKQSQIESPSS